MKPTIQQDDAWEMLKCIGHVVRNTDPHEECRCDDLRAMGDERKCPYCEARNLYERLFIKYEANS